ncbi:protein of unknown function [Taphrina deformans PYCC 5710]|uniref:Zinc/iron permease n=1 Tax=Taphrina deformans (strain PYCC 5710 / ATCC 11124 / CBS 356.35 / IMI 108563 / JCM 9778 / NBRC 8474) TaxID=1097556 RepID=R4XGR2_TAPDE|nr:protein of unknown function [Taphrina deformans PYCC 5710]|eukprot:CCG84859.1 protein of unknown function [Taphrina deformans PYCC 5710]
MGPSGSDSQAWVLTLASSLACAIGSLFIYVDLLVRLIPGHESFDFQKDKRFLVGSLSLGAGVLLFTALNRILPEGAEYLSAKDEHGKRLFSKKSYSDAILMASFIGGIILCIALNAVLHRLTPQSIVHCGDEDEHGNEESTAESSSTTPPDSHDESSDQRNSESAPLLPKNLTNRQKRSVSFMRACKHSESSQCAGFTDPCKHDDICCVHAKDASHPESHGRSSMRRHESRRSEAGSEHHHHITQERHDLLRIGFQTAIAITLHKVPEGFITFMANHRDASVGFSIFLALGIHNIVEGFTIAFPLYLAWQSRTKAILVALALGGLSQPLGALLAYGVTRTKFGRSNDSPQLDLAYGILFGATSGFMSVIAVSSMLPQAIRNDAHDGFLFTLFFFLGTAIIGLSSVLSE